jgi:hypothetical protein
MNRKVEIMFDKENRQREAKKRLKEKQLALVNGSKKMVVVGATTLVLAGAFSCSQASAYDRYDDNSYRGIGYMCFSDEVGSDGDGSYVSPGTGDYGGISYGLYQFSTTTGSAKDFVNWSKDSDYPEIYKIFQDAGNPKAGTPAFGKAWKKCYRELEGKFEEAQTEFAMGELINPGYEKVKKETGIDLKKSRARTEFLISTANQFGRGGIVTLFKEVQNKGIKLSDDMSDTELLGIMCQHKYDTVDYHFRSSSSAVQRSARLRFKREKKELLKIAKEEEGPKLDEIDTNKEQTEATKTETSSSKTSKKEVVNDTADKYQGKGITYDFGEKNYKSGSLDCSGLISQMMNDMGVKVDAGNTNALAFSNNSKKISKDEVQPGDLVFWNDDNGSRHNSVYHIGMYVGNDTIVDCSPSHNGVGTRKLSQCKDTGDMHYTYGRYTKLENKMKDYAQKIVESIDEFDDVITVDDSNIEKDYKKVEEKTTELKEAINENAKEDNNQKEESSKEDKSEETSKEDREDNKEDNNVQEENKKDNETSLDKSEDASNKDEFESIIDEDKTDKSEEENNQKEESSNEDKEEETSKESNESSKEDKTEESSEDKEETNDSTLDKTLVVGDSHAKALEDKLKDNKDTEVEATVGASAYVYLNDTNYFGDKLIDKLPKDSDKINKVIISLGVNNIEGNSNINDVKKVIDKIESMYPGKDIYFMKVNHVGDKYKDGDVDKTNKMIDDLNKEIENYVKDKDKVKVIDASKGLETEGKLTETSDGLHVKDNDKLIDNLEKGIEENKKDNETSLDKSEDASNKDEFESIIDEDKTDKSEETSKEEDKSNENNQKEESSKEDKEEDSSNKEESAVEKEETSKEDNNVQEEDNQKEETTESSKEESAVEKEETSKEDNNVQEEDNQKEETTESSKEESAVEKEESSKEDNNVQEENNQKEEIIESSKEDKSEESSKEYNNVQESTKETSNEDKEENVVKEQKETSNEDKEENVVKEQKETSNEDKEENVVKEQKETSKEEDKSEVKQTVQDKSNESSKEEKPVVEEQKSVNNNQESATETSKEDNSESQKENSRVDELHSRLQNNLFGRILMS